jgi:tRNA modification GTPase
VLEPHLQDDTIAALASAPGPAVRGIVRVSGPRVKEIVAGVFTPQDAARWECARIPRRHAGRIALREVHLPLPVDVLFWPTGRSYTGQPTAEIHTFGSPPLLDAVLAALYAAGARPAERGEFTLRAFLAGRIDLMQAEAVLGVIEASDEQQLRVALDQLGGGLSQRIAALHEELLLHLADLEAGLDFVEEDIEFVSREQMIRQIDGGLEFLGELLEQAASRLQTTGRHKVVLAGLPNAGKSTLLNALCAAEHAIVSHTAGTTRDYLSAAVDWNGLAIELIDTAGWMRQTSSGAAATIESAADALRHEQWERANLIVWCSAADMDAAAAALDARLRQECLPGGIPVVQLTTKADLRDVTSPQTPHPVSTVTGTGVEEVKSEVTARLQAYSGSEHVLGTTAARCRDSLEGALETLHRAKQAAMAGLGDELIAVELRAALDHLGRIAGRVYTDDILDRIFSRFCIGK